MMAMYKTKRFNWSLFIGHLVIEKLLKAYFEKVNNDYPPITHNLLKIAEKSKIEINKEIKIFLASVTAFNINERYDDYKMSFQKKCTKEFTIHWIKQIKKYRLWLKKLIEY